MTAAGEPLPASSYCVVIPAHDEAQSVAAAVESVQRAAMHTPAAVRVLVVADSCTDRTAECARSLHADVMLVDVRCVGAARSAGFSRILGQEPRGLARRGVWFASTDADSRVPPTWFTTLDRAREAGAEVVAGTVDLEPPHGPREIRWAREYQAKIDHPRHRHVHGANLALSADAYVRLGGFRPLRTAEDVDLVRRAMAAGMRVQWTLDSPVITSPRITGRAPAGFADYLRSLAP